MGASESADVTTGPASPEMRQAFAAALDEAIRAASTPVAVAEHVGLSDDAVRKWTRGLSEPPPLTVFAVERFLGLAPGELSRHLGYLPVGASTSVAAAVDADPRLNEVGRAGVLGAYRALRQ